MPATDAIVLDNWYPETDGVRVRPGFTEHATGLGASVESLFEYVAPDGSSTLFAAADGKIFDVTSAGAVGAPVVTGMTNDRWQTVQISNAASDSYLLAFNGQDIPREYDGSAWSAASITGPTVEALVWCNVHQRRLWVGEVDSLDAYYLGINAKGGAATAFYLGGLVKLGGYIMAMGTWTSDGGAGPDDNAVFITSEGEAVVYAGTDPSSASTWGLVGVYRVGKPIGRRCLVKYGADLMMITETGLVAASSLLSADQSQFSELALSAKINGLVNADVRAYGNITGWEPFIYPKGAMLLFNVPTGGTSAVQYAFNILTKAACRFTGMDARCWSLRDGTPFFATASGSVYQFDTGDTDDGKAIEADAVQAFDAFKTPGQKKAFKRVEVVARASSDPTFAVELNTDYVVTVFSAVTAQQETNTALWDVALWDAALWGDDNQIWSGWRAVSGQGRVASIRVRSATTVGRAMWLSTNWLYVPGGLL
jgi:hypothetical protein